MQLNLTALEGRILGALVEKEITTPEYYPLTLNGLVAACNQKNNRDPVMQLSADEISKGLDSLQYAHKLVGTYTGAGSRVVKYTHRLIETLGVDTPELAILCELMLRGPQTPGELRGRASRMHAFASPAEVKAVLDALAARQPDPYVVELPRAAGCKENRHAHLLGDVPVDLLLSSPPRAAATAPARERASDNGERIRALEERLASIEAQIAALRAGQAREPVDRSDGSRTP
jgi:uncharacterized protein YceH (UPF0502 family)